jgi:hypothetical protein
MDYGAFLANYDAAGRDQLAAEAFYAQTFGVTVTSVAATAAAFFGCHKTLLPILVLTYNSNKDCCAHQKTGGSVAVPATR